MENFDGFTIFMAGFALGLIGAHYLNKHELKLSYDRGRIDAFWEIWCTIVQHELGIGGKSFRHAQDGGRDNVDKAAQ